MATAGPTPRTGHSRARRVLTFILFGLAILAVWEAVKWLGGVPWREHQVDWHSASEEPLRGHHAIAAVITVPNEHYDTLARLHQPKHLFGYGVPSALL